jgi:ATP-dependent NAD(P)H-hydrate dehydratase
MSEKLGGVTVLQKAGADIISVHATSSGDKHSQEVEKEGETDETITIDVEGGMKRCGGQGDILSGTVGCALAWGLNYSEGVYGFVLLLPSHSRSSCSITRDREQKIPATRIPLLASAAGSIVTRTCSRMAFKKYGRGVVTQDMLSEIGGAFGEVFGDEAFWGEGGKAE